LGPKKKNLKCLLAASILNWAASILNWDFNLEEVILIEVPFKKNSSACSVLKQRITDRHLAKLSLHSEAETQSCSGNQDASENRILGTRTTEDTQHEQPNISLSCP
jgi:hypothetical protein